MIISDTKYHAIMAQITAELMKSRTLIHQMHLATSSYAQHKALDDYYSDIVDLIDTLVETYQGEYGLIGKYPEPKLSGTVSVAYLSSLLSFLKQNRYKACAEEDTHLQNIFDEIVALIYQTLYKLK